VVTDRQWTHPKEHGLPLAETALQLGNKAEGSNMTLHIPLQLCQFGFLPKWDPTQGVIACHGNVDNLHAPHHHRLRKLVDFAVVKASSK
jgi:hypothetical protein